MGDLSELACAQAKLKHITDGKIHQALCDDLGTDRDQTGPSLLEFLQEVTREMRFRDCWDESTQDCDFMADRCMLDQRLRCDEERTTRGEFRHDWRKFHRPVSTPSRHSWKFSKGVDGMGFASDRAEIGLRKFDGPAENAKSPTSRIYVD